MFGRDFYPMSKTRITELHCQHKSSPLLTALHPFPFLPPIEGSLCSEAQLVLVMVLTMQKAIQLPPSIPTLVLLSDVFLCSPWCRGLILMLLPHSQKLIPPGMKNPVINPLDVKMSLLSKQILS